MKNILIEILHWLIIIALWSSPFWLDWRLIAIGTAIYWLQILIFKACVLTIAQFGDKDTGFFGQYLNKLFKFLFNKEVPMKKLRFFLDWVMPIVFIILGFVFQEIVKK